MERLTKAMDKYLSEAKKNVLNLVVSKQWFDMIVSGEKTEEYREIKPYWIKRLVNQDADSGFIGLDEHGIKTVIYGELEYIPYTYVRFFHGYAKKRPWIEKKIVSITIGKPQSGLCPKEFENKEFFRGTCINLCLGIDVSKSKQEELDIYDTMQLCPK